MAGARAGRRLPRWRKALPPWPPTTCPTFRASAKAPPPPETWGTRDYADETAKWLVTLPAAPRIWVGHSFGCRVGMVLAAHYPRLFDKMVLIAPAGLKRKRTMFQKISHNTKVYTFKTLKHFVPEGPKRDALRARFGSADYRTAGVLRDSFVRIVNEDLKDDAKKIIHPTLLICGAQDTETPPEMTHRLNRKIPNSQAQILDGFDHFTILTTGKHQVAALIKGFIES